ncbi:NrfD/PsrC family molybdoenzyme membrane anchor subunit [Chloroflexota bacterium]
MAWIAPIWIYLWLAGMAGGAYFAAFLAEHFTGASDRKLLKLATYVGVPLAVLGVLLLVVDLGSPLRFWHLFTQFDVMSPMSMGTWILLAWVGIAVIMVILWWMVPTRQNLADLLSKVNLVLAVLLITYTGVLLAVSNQPLWASTVLLPALFVVSAISTGVALLIITAITSGTSGITRQMVGRLAEVDAIAIIVELVVLIGYAIWLGASSMAGASEALGLLTTGALAAPFWVGVVLVALLIPLGLDLKNWGKDVESKSVWGAIATSAVCVILGGLVLRAVITIGGQL